jgi:type IV secretory pathway VirB2 component (pilin)
MATKTKRTKKSGGTEPVLAPILDGRGLPLPEQAPLTHPDPALLHLVPQDAVAEGKLARVENLLGKGHFGAALREAQEFHPADPALAGRYEFIRQEKVSRAQIGIADRYFLRGDRESARQFYERAVQLETADPAVREVAELAGQVFDDLTSSRRELISALRADAQAGNFTEWCGRKKTLTGGTILDVGPVRERIYPDFRFETVFGERPPIKADPGYLDPLPPETEFVAFTSAVPGAIFRAATRGAIDIDLPQAEVPGDPPGNRFRASLALPVFANVFTAKLGLFAIDQGLSVTGQADGVVPLFRYEYLRDKAKDLIAQVQEIDSRMLPIQFKLDDFVEALSAIKRPLAAQQAELEAVKQRIAELIQDLAAAAQVEQALVQVIDALDAVEEECDCDWFCWLVTIVVGIVLATAAVAVIIAIGIALAAGAVAAPLVLVALNEIFAAGGTLFLIELHEALSCRNVPVLAGRMRTTLDGVRGGIAESEAELSHALVIRDILIARINALSDQLEQVYQSNAARVLDAKTLDAIQAQYNLLRQSLVTRAQAVARLAESAFNFERDADTHLIRDTYYDTSLEGYTAAETLLHDLGGFDHIDLVGRTRKAMQLSHMVSLRKHSPLSFLALATTRTGRFTTTLPDFDRWYPGTYLQRIMEVRVEILVDGEAVPARGYISNDGVSLVRFADPENKRPVDNTRVFDEPDPDLAKLCYKRLQRRRHVDTMAFPEFTSYLHEERMRNLQARERNFFENIGLESTWLIELLPDQSFDLARVTDIRVHFQYEALFDENLKRVLEPKRYAGRQETVALPIGRLLRERCEATDFSAGVTFQTTRALFEAPAVEKTIVDAGFAVRLKDGNPLNGAARLRVSFQGATPATLETNDSGVVATAPDHPTGTGLAKLAAMTQGKSVAGRWTVKLVRLPPGIGMDEVDEVFLLLNCEYAP